MKKTVSRKREKRDLSVFFALCVSRSAHASYYLMKDRRVDEKDIHQSAEFGRIWRDESEPVHF